MVLKPIVSEIFVLCLLCLILWGLTAALAKHFSKSSLGNGEEFQVTVKPSQIHILPTTVQGKGSEWKQRPGGERVRHRFKVKLDRNI